MSTVLNVTVDQGANVSIEINATHANGSVIDLTGYTANSGFKKHANAYSNTTTYFTNTLNANDLLVMALSAVNSANVDAGRYSYDVRITETSSNTTTRLQEGILFIRPSVV